MERTEGQIKLYSLNIHQSVIARAAGISEPYLTQCLKGRKKPSKKIIAAAEKLTGLKGADLFPALNGAAK